MPVRSSTSRVLRWPNREEVEAGLRAWAEELARSPLGLVAAGYFGSYARGDWGPGSDVDVLLIVNTSDIPFARRPAPDGAVTLPVPADVLTYTAEEWLTVIQREDRFGRVMREEAVWVAGEPPRR